MQVETAVLRLERQQMGTERGILDQVIHARLADFNICALCIELDVDARILSSDGFAILKQIEANRLFRIFDAEDCIDRACVIAQHSMALAGSRGYAGLLRPPFAREHHSAVLWFAVSVEVRG